MHTTVQQCLSIQKYKFQYKNKIGEIGRYIHPYTSPNTSKLTSIYNTMHLHTSYTKTTKDIYVCGAYIPRCNSRYFRPELFEELESDIEKFSSLGSILIMGTRKGLIKHCQIRTLNR